MSAEEREARIRDLFPLVRSVARRVLRMVPSADRDDLIGDGSVGLVRAVDTFDPEYGVALESYANRLIAGAMLNGLRRLDPVSERVRRRLRHAEARRNELAQARGTLPTYAEMEAEDAALRRARIAAHRYVPLSLDTPLPDRESGLARREDDPLVGVLERLGRRELAEAVALLPPRERKLMVLHYYREIPLRSIGEAMKISPQRASQLHLAALARLRKHPFAR